MATISELNANIASAKKNIATYNGYIKDANEEIDNCKKLNKVLDELSNNASNCSLKLGNVYSSMSAGISEASINGKINNIDEKRKFFSILSENAQNAKGNVSNRINELGLNIDDWNSKIESCNSHIDAWEREKNSLWTKLHSFVANDNGGDENK